MKQFELDLIKLSRIIVYVGLINGLICIIQFFISPTLFGLYNYSFYQLDIIGYRPGALLGSPQIYGLFVILASIIAFEIYATTKDKWFLLYGFTLIPLSLLSGNRSVLFCILVYGLFRLPSLISIKKLLSWQTPLIVVLIISSLLVLSNLSKSNVTISKNIERVTLIFSDQESLRQGENRGRIRIYNEFFESYNGDVSKIVIGNGIGYYSSLARGSEGNNQNATESYLLTVLGEYGVIVLFLYICLWIKSIYMSRIKRIEFNLFIINSITGLTLIFVHAFAHPIFFLFWPLVLYPIMKGKPIYIKSV